MTDTTTPRTDEERWLFEYKLEECISETECNLIIDDDLLVREIFTFAWLAATTNMQSKVSELEKENDRLRKQIEKNISNAFKHNDKVRELEAKIDELQKNADRYRWLANEVLYCDYGDNDRENEIGWGVQLKRSSQEPFMFGKSINEAIDVAIAEEGVK